MKKPKGTKVVRQIVFALLFTAAAAISCALFPVLAQDQYTFIDRSMDPDATIEKYKDVWDDTAIKQEKDPHLEYSPGDTIGTITIPELDIYELPISYDSNYLASNWKISAPGHSGGWGVPGESTPTCIGSHNYQLFHDLPKLHIGDRFIIETETDTFVYIVTETQVYNHLYDNWNETAFSSKKPYSVELMTCYPISTVTTDDTYIVTAQMQKGTQFID